MNPFLNRWIMRIKEARTVLVVAMWGIITEVQVLGFVRPYLPQNALIAVAVVMPLAGLGFAYWYDKSQTMKGEQRHRIRRKENFIDEKMVLNHLGLLEAIAGLPDVDRDELLANYRSFVQDHHDGIDINEVIRA